MSKAQKIEAMLAQGKSPAVIAAKLKTTKQYVYTIASKKRKSTQRQAARKAELHDRHKEPTLWQRIVRWIKGE